MLGPEANLKAKLVKEEGMGLERGWRETTSLEAEGRGLQWTACRVIKTKQTRNKSRYVVAMYGGNREREKNYVLVKMCCVWLGLYNGKGGGDGGDVSMYVEGGRVGPSTGGFDSALPLILRASESLVFDNCSTLTLYHIPPILLSTFIII